MTQIYPHDEQIRLSLHERLMELLAQALDSALAGRSQHSSDQHFRWQIVRQAEDTVHANIGSPITLADLCSSANGHHRRDALGFRAARKLLARVPAILW